MEQQIRFCTTSDGVRIAYATAGKGPPLVVAHGWVSHLQVEWDYADTRAFWQGLAEPRLLVRLDKRGTGLSDWDAPDLSMEGQLRDLEAVVDALAVERVALMGISEGGPTILVYATRHPERVSRLVLYGSYHRWAPRPEVYEPFKALVRAAWGAGSAAISSVFAPSGDPAQVAFLTKLQREAASAENAVTWMDANYGQDVTSVLEEVQAPTLVVHRRGDILCPFDVAREMTALIPDARLEPLEGDVHVPWWGDTKPLLDAINGFLMEAESQVRAEPVPSGLATILFTDMESSTALTERLGDAKAQELRRAHDSIVREALKAQGGSETKHTGDGIMASFPSASRAIECAVAVQRAIAEQGDMPLRVRIGMNAGEPVAEEADLFGTAVNLAKRICDHAEPGQILVSDVVQQLAAGKGFAFADKGEATLKGFEKPVRLHEVRWQE